MMIAKSCDLSKIVLNPKSFVLFLITGVYKDTKH